MHVSEVNVDLPLAPGDEVVAVVSHRGYVVIITKLGAMFRVFGEEF